MTKQTVLTEEHVITVETIVSVADRRVSWDDIETSIEYDDRCEAPWDECDGFEHEFERETYHDDERRRDSHAYVNRSPRDGGSGWIVIDDATVIDKWGCVGPAGCSRQVRAESIARAKRQTIEQLVKWYENGWQWYGARAQFGEYEDSVWGIDSEEYAVEVAETEMRWEVAAQLEENGFIVADKPAPRIYNPVDVMRNRIRRNLGSVA